MKSSFSNTLKGFGGVCKLTKVLLCSELPNCEARYPRYLIQTHRRKTFSRCHTLPIILVTSMWRISTRHKNHGYFETHLKWFSEWLCSQEPFVTNWPLKVPPISTSDLLLWISHHSLLLLDNPSRYFDTNLESSSCGTLSRPLSKFGPIAKSIPIFGFCSDASHSYWSFHFKQIWSQNLECCASLAYVSIQPISLVKFHC